MITNDIQAVLDEVNGANDIDYYAKVLNADFRVLNSKLNVVLILFIGNMKKLCFVQELL